LFCLELFFLLIPNERLILDEAAANGFYYRNVSIKEGIECTAPDFCLKSGSKLYLITKNDTFSVETKREKEHIRLTVKPDKNYMAYYLYMQRGFLVEKKKITAREITIEKSLSLDAFQITGITSNGPSILYMQRINSTKTPLFTGDFLSSINQLRKDIGIKPLKADKTLKKAADDSIKRILHKKLVHIAADGRSVRESIYGRAFVGENLFAAKSMENGWKMLIESPSHLYNIVHTDFKNMWFEKSYDENDLLNGVIVFSD